jgi:hypothetical protein
VTQNSKEPEITETEAGYKLAACFFTVGPAVMFYASRNNPHLSTMTGFGWYADGLAFELTLGVFALCLYLAYLAIAVVVVMGYAVFDSVRRKVN